MKRYALILLAVAAVGGVAVLFAARADKAPEPASGSSAAPRFDIDDSAKKNPWTGLTPNWAADQFQFAVVADRTGGHRKGVFSKAVQQINLMHPEFVMSVGDLIEGGGTAESLNKQWDEFDGYAKQFQMPFFYCPGNHDAASVAKQDVWAERLGKKYYHFAYKNCLFVVLNDMDYDADDPKDPPKAGSLRVGKRQREYLADALKRYPNAAFTFVFLHHPIWNQKDLAATGWPEVEQLLAGRKHWAFCGHVHTYRKYLRNGTSYYQLATTGGSSALRGVEFGEFDQIGWVTMTKDGPTLANVSLDGIFKDDLKPFATEESGNEISRDPYPTVTGSVKADGKPAAGWQVAFNLIGEDDVVSTVSTRVRADGTFALYGRKGVPVKPGKYFVTFAPAAAFVDDPKADAPANPIPEKYRKPQTTPLTATVKVGGPNQFEFDVK
jgi:serine/threonine-protein phosphatase CPPED1